MKGKKVASWILAGVIVAGGIGYGAVKNADKLPFGQSKMKVVYKNDTNQGQEADGNVLLMMVAVTLGADWLETALLRVFNGVFKGNASKNAMYAVVGTRAVYDLATILVTVILFKFVDVIALGIGAALVLLGVYVEFAAYMHVVEMNEDKKAIAFFIAKICTLIIALLVVVTLGKDILYIISNWNNIGYYMN